MKTAKREAHILEKSRDSDLSSLKQRLIQHLASGDHLGAADVRRELELARIRRRVNELAEAPASTGPSSVTWVGQDGVEETIVMEATPEAKKYFAAQSETEED